jgi:hypothetical protein
MTDLPAMTAPAITTRSTRREPDDASFHEAARRMPRVVLLTLAATALVMAALLVLVNRAEWWRGFLAASVVSALSAMVSLAPLLWGLRGGSGRAPAGVLAATGVRAGLSIGGCALAVGVGGYPAVPTFLIMMAFYLSILATETAVLSGTLWRGETATVKSTKDASEKAL